MRCRAGPSKLQLLQEWFGLKALGAAQYRFRTWIRGSGSSIARHDLRRRVANGRIVRGRDCTGYTWHVAILKSTGVSVSIEMPQSY